MSFLAENAKMREYNAPSEMNLSLPTLYRSIKVVGFMPTLTPFFRRNGFDRVFQWFMLPKMPRCFGKFF